MNYPKRHFYKWSTKEYSLLRSRFESGMSIEQIAEYHQRSVRAIEFALRRIDADYDMIINGKNYSILFNKVRQMIQLKIDLLAA